MVFSPLVVPTRLKTCVYGVLVCYFHDGTNFLETNNCREEITGDMVNDGTDSAVSPTVV